MRRLFAGVLVAAPWLLGVQAAVALPGFTPVPGSPFATGSSPHSIAFDGRFVATADTGSNDVSMFSVSSGGVLTPVPGSPFTTGAAPEAVALAGGGVPGNGLLAVANSGSNNVSMFTVSAGGVLTPVPGSPFATGADPVAVVFGYGGAGTELLFVANRGDNTVSQFDVSRDGSLLGGSPSPTGGVGPQSLAFVGVSSSGGALAVANGGSNNLSIGAPAGRFVNAGPTGAAPSSVAFGPAIPTPGGVDVLAVANSGSNNVSMFETLPPFGGGRVGPPFAAGAAPSSVAFGPTGSILAVANRGDNNVSVFSVSSSGALAPVPGSPLSLGGGSGPASLAFSPDGSLLALANSTTNNISVFRVQSCTTQFNQGFNAGYDSGFKSELRHSYRRHGAWQLGWKRGFQDAHRRHAARRSARVAAPAALARSQSSPIAAVVGCDVVFNSGFNVGYKGGFKSAFNPAFRRGYKAGLAASHSHR